MIITREEQKFEPVVITLESLEEFEHLLVALNTTRETLEVQAHSIGLTKFEPNGKVYGPMFNKLHDLRRQGKV